MPEAEPTPEAPKYYRTKFTSEEAAREYVEIVARLMGYPRQGICAGGWAPPPGGGMTLRYVEAQPDPTTKQWCVPIEPPMETADTAALTLAELTVHAAVVGAKTEYDPTAIAVAE